MPIPFKPASARAAARGLRVVEGEPSAAARAKALRASAARRAQPEYTLIEGEAEKTFRGVRPDIEASAATELAPTREAMARHARARNVFVQSKDRPVVDLDAARAEAAREAERDVGRAAQRDLNRDFRGAVEDDARRRALRRGRGGPPREPGPEDVMRGPRLQDRGRGDFLDAFEDRYGWRPATEREARDMLSPEALRELGFYEE